MFDNIETQQTRKLERYRNRSRFQERIDGKGGGSPFNKYALREFR